MAVASFRDLCDAYCEILGVPPPELAADKHGLIAFHVVQRGVTVNIVHSPRESAQHAFVQVEFGPLPAKGVQRALESMLDANFFPGRVHPPTFGRNPATGDAVLHFVYSFFEATATGLFELVEDGVDLALRWRQGRLFEDSDAGVGHHGEQSASSFASFA